MPGTPCCLPPVGILTRGLSHAAESPADQCTCHRDRDRGPQQVAGLNPSPRTLISLQGWRGQHRDQHLHAGWSRTMAGHRCYGSSRAGQGLTGTQEKWPLSPPLRLCQGGQRRARTQSRQKGAARAGGMCCCMGGRRSQQRNVLCHGQGRGERKRNQKARKINSVSPRPTGPRSFWSQFFSFSLLNKT